MRPGTRIELHPGCDRWMMGDRFGTVVSVFHADNKERTNKERVRVKLDKSGRTFTFPSDRVTEI